MVSSTLKIVMISKELILYITHRIGFARYGGRNNTTFIIIEEDSYMILPCWYTSVFYNLRAKSNGWKLVKCYYIADLIPTPKLHGINMPLVLKGESFEQQ